MTPIEKPALPPLPEKIFIGTSRFGSVFYGYIDHHLTAYADTCMAPLLARIEEQRLIISALNDCIGGPGSLTTENIQRVGNRVLLDRIEELERQNEAQKDEWLSWDAKRAALEKDAARWRFSMRYQKRYEETPELRCEAMDEMWRKVYQERRRAPTREEYEAATDAAIAECAAMAAKD